MPLAEGTTSGVELLFCNQKPSMYRWLAPELPASQGSELRSFPSVCSAQEKYILCMCTIYNGTSDERTWQSLCKKKKDITYHK